MDRDEKIDGLVNHLLVAHEDHRESRDDNARLLSDLEKLTSAIRESGKNTYEVQLDLEAFTAEARLLINDRINEMSVERLAEVLTRKKLDQVRAFLYAREKGIPYEPPEPTQPTPKVDAQEDERRDPWYARLFRAVLRTPPSTLLVLVLLLFVSAAAMVIGLRLLSALDHSHILPSQERSEGK